MLATVPCYSQTPGPEIREGPASLQCRTYPTSLLAAEKRHTGRAQLSAVLNQAHVHVRTYVWVFMCLYIHIYMYTSILIYNVYAHTLHTPDQIVPWHIGHIIP